MHLNCDMGESYGPWKMGNDEAVMPLIDWANIACGGHAGDPDVMARTLALALEHGVRPGAHPGYPDRRNFGRIQMDGPRDSLVREVQAQIGGLQALATVEGATLHHIKPHGALYNAMMRDDELLSALAQAVSVLDPSLVFVLQATPQHEHHKELLASTGLALAFEAFADRRYTTDGRLAARSGVGAVISDPDEVEEHVRTMIDGSVQTPSGSLPLRADTLCVHGDNPSALAAVERVRTLIPRTN